MDQLPKNKKIILFDGLCKLCNSAVLRVVKYDKKNIFVFASLQSDIGKNIADYLNIDASKIDTIILFEPQVAYYIKSTAALKIATHFGGFWKLLQVFVVLPESFRNMLYDLVAKNRYKWFEKKESCVLASLTLKHKFLD
ncbi:MAG: DCC1-like thiol-disulfide oxidoreductase family protein [Polaribacter sp.]|nr:DCC1-like thiol-disulfide oxidoreductase family protein [Polaribacter sp.]